MTDAPKRIYTTEHPTSMAYGRAHVHPFTGATEYHLTRPGQPCSTEEFLAKVMQWWSKHPSDPSDEDLIVRLWNWHDGDFTAAMEGLE